MKVQINFWNGKGTLEYDAENIKQAVELAVKDGADLSRADLSRANLYGADLSGADLSRAKLDGANLSGADLSGADLSRAKLDGANLYGADLSGADLSRANLDGANLPGADLSRANLDGANLSRANLSGADISRANLDGANLSRANLWSKRPILQLGLCGSVNRTTLVYFFEDKRDPLIKCGCFSGNIAEFKAKIKATHSGTFHELEYNIMVQHIEAIYELNKADKS